jgi:hypothetical protein
VDDLNTVSSYRICSLTLPVHPFDVKLRISKAILMWTRFLIVPWMDNCTTKDNGSVVSSSAGVDIGGGNGVWYYQEESGKGAKRCESPNISKTEDFLTC